MHSMKQSPGGSRSKRWWQWRGSQMRRSVSNTQGVRRAAEVLEMSPGSSRGGCEGSAANRQQMIPISSLYMDLGHIIHMGWGSSAALRGHRQDCCLLYPIQEVLPQFWGEFCPFPDPVQPQKQGTIVGPLMVSSHPISKLKVFSFCCFLLIVMYVKEICEHSGG